LCGYIIHALVLAESDKRLRIGGSE
jgi:hypothetical protein